MRTSRADHGIDDHCGFRVILTVATVLPLVGIRVPMYVRPRAMMGSERRR